MRCYRLLEHRLVVDEDMGRGSLLIRAKTEAIDLILLWCDESRFCSFLSSWSAGPEAGCPACPASLPLVCRCGEHFLARLLCRPIGLWRAGYMGSFWKSAFLLYENIWGLKHFLSGLGKEYFQLVISGGKNWNSTHFWYGNFVLSFWLMTFKFTLFLLSWIKTKLHKVILTEVNRC